MSEAIVLSENSRRLEFVPTTNVTADNLEELVREELGRIGEGFLRLGYYFEQAKNCRLYESFGYNSVFELAEDLFDLKESSVYDMMAVWRRFHSNKDALALRDDCRGLKYSQLVECLRDKWSGGTVVRVISSADTIKETRAKVTAWNTLVEKISGYPSLEQVEREVECAQLRKERKEAENSRRLENSAPELKGQLPGQTSFFVEGYVKEPDEPQEEPQKFQTSGISEEELEINEVLKAAKAKSDSYQAFSCSPYNRVHSNKMLAVGNIELLEKEDKRSMIDFFFNEAIRNLAIMRRYKLRELEEKEK